MSWLKYRIEAKRPKNIFKKKERNQNRDKNGIDINESKQMLLLFHVC